MLSDLHFDYYFKPNDISEVDIRKAYDRYFIENREVGDVLVIAGDLGHFNDQNIMILKMIKRLYGYKAIVCVLGNHDYHLVKANTAKAYESSLDRVSEMRELINKENGMYCLDGNVALIDGVKFGGADGWYSRDFLDKHLYDPFNSTRSINQMWKNVMPDQKFIKGIENFDNLFEIELPKIEAVYQKCDIMITHVNPSIELENIPEPYRKSQSTTFFSFDGSKYIKEGSMKHWIFGHNHNNFSYVVDGVECHNNAYHHYGKVTMKSIEI